MSETAMKTLVCDLCGGTVEIVRAGRGKCRYCGAECTVHNWADQTEGLLSAARSERLVADFNKAVKLYEEILAKDPACLDAMWGLLLSRYGIEYVKDDGYKPTCHRASTKPFTEDAVFKKLMQSASGEEKRNYEARADEIERIRARVIELSKNKEPYDVFICYKDRAADGSQTKDSLWARDIYHELDKRGYRVFFAGITLNRLAGEEYEPNIFAALNSASVMLAVTSDLTYLNSVWVKNEWTRYLELIRGTEKKLIVCRRGIDPYDLPQELRACQALDGDALHFLLDLTANVEKTVNKFTVKATLTRREIGVKKFEKSTTLNKTEIVKRKFEQRLAGSVPATEALNMNQANEFLKMGQFKNAARFYDIVLAANPNQHEAHFGRLLASFSATDRDALIERCAKMENFTDFENAVNTAPEEAAKGYVETLYKAALKWRTPALFTECVQWTDQNETKCLVGVYADYARATLNAPLFDLSCTALNNNEVDTYVENCTWFANNLRSAKWWQKADTYYEKALSADRNCQQAYWGKFLTALRVTGTDSRKFATAMLKADFKAVEDVLSFGFNNGIVTAIANAAGAIASKGNHLKNAAACKLFENAAACVPESEQEFYRRLLLDFSRLLIGNGYFKQAGKYCNQLLAINGKDDTAHFFKALIVTKRRSEEELVCLKRPQLIDIPEYQNAMNCSPGAQSKYLDIYKKQETIKRQKLRSKINCLRRSHIDIDGINFDELGDFVNRESAALDKRRWKSIGGVSRRLPRCCLVALIILLLFLFVLGCGWVEIGPILLIVYHVAGGGFWGSSLDLFGFSIRWAEVVYGAVNIVYWILALVFAVSFLLRAICKRRG